MTTPDKMDEEELREDEYSMEDMTEEEERIPVQSFNISDPVGKAIYEFCLYLIELNIKREGRKEQRDKAKLLKRQLTIQLNQWLVDYGETCLPAYYDPSSKRPVFVKKLIKNSIFKQNKKQVESGLNCLKQWVASGKLEEKLPIQVYLGMNKELSQQYMMNVENTFKHLIKESSKEANTKKKIVIEVNEKKPSHFSIFKCTPINDPGLTNLCMKYIHCIQQMKKISEKNKNQLLEFKKKFPPLLVPIDQQSNAVYQQLIQLRKQQQALRKSKKEKEPEYQPTQEQLQQRRLISQFLAQHGGEKKCFKFQIVAQKPATDSKGNPIPNAPPITETNEYILSESQSKKSYSLTMDDLEICNKFALKKVFEKHKLSPDMTFDPKNENLKRFLMSDVFAKDYKQMYEDICHLIMDSRAIYFWKLSLKRSRKNTDKPKNPEKAKLIQEINSLNEQLILMQIQTGLEQQRIKRINKEWNASVKAKEKQNTTVKKKKETAEEFQNLLMSQKTVTPRQLKVNNVNPFSELQTLIPQMTSQQPIAPTPTITTTSTPQPQMTHPPAPPQMPPPTRPIAPVVASRRKNSTPQPPNK